MADGLTGSVSQSSAVKPTLPMGVVTSYVMVVCSLGLRCVRLLWQSRTLAILKQRLCKRPEDSRLRAMPMRHLILRATGPLKRTKPQAKEIRDSGWANRAHQPIVRCKIQAAYGCYYAISYRRRRARSLLGHKQPNTYISSAPLTRHLEQ
ncbi:hypothetical protein ElyMa_001104100 [Elysia marginata]|uniref:Uncharacterized protein n=1 Tax=Elysia marginata TaxID=1093978 RepID=A0AAV4HWE1_9GAST|nr:hypothetical protein ElyMa_001104100 [Elysia marginata]